MQLRGSLHILTHLLALELQDKDAVGARGGVVLGRFAHDTVRISDEQQVQGVFFVLCAVHREVLQHELVVAHLVHADLGQIEETLSLVLTVQQVIPAIVVDFEITDIDLV